MESVNNENELVETKEKELIESKKENKKEKVKKDRTKLKNFVFSAAIIVILFILAASIAPKVLQNDTFYTIKIGEYIYNNGIANLTEDVYSWHDLAYTYPHWLYDLIMFLIFNAFGHFGIYVSTMVLYGLLGTMIYLFAKNKSNNRVVSAIVAIFAVYMLEPYMAARAQSATYILFIWAIFCIEKYLATYKKRYLVPLIVIPILITNLHCAVFPFYFVLFMPYLAEYLIAVIVDLDLDRKLMRLFLKLRIKIAKEDKEVKLKEKLEAFDEYTVVRKEKKAKLRENPYKIKVVKNHAMVVLIGVMIVAALTGFLNPAGTGAYTYLIKTYEGNTTQSINEHLPVTLIESPEFLTAIVVGMALLMFIDTKIRLPDLFMVAGLAFLALKSRRQISMFIIFGLPVIATLVSMVLRKYDKDKLTNWIFKFCTDIFGVIIIISLSVIASVEDYKVRMNQDYISDSSYPVEAAAWIKENLDLTTLKLYNEYNYGSYLLLNDIPVFIDSRCDLYTPEFNRDTGHGASGKDIFSDAINIANRSANYEEKFEEYGVNHVMLYADANLASALDTNSNYKKIYADDRFVIFERLNVNAASETEAEGEKITSEES